MNVSIYPGGMGLNRRFIDLKPSDLAKLPNLSSDHFCIAEERIHMHLYNEKKMHWYLAEYGPIGKRFFGFFQDNSNGMSSGFCSLEDLLKLCKKGGPWEPMVDENWKPVASKEIPNLQGYIKMMICSPDMM
jgi:hypothetical protein